MTKKNNWGTWVSVATILAVAGCHESELPEGETDGETDPSGGAASDADSDSGGDPTGGASDSDATDSTSTGGDTDGDTAGGTDTGEPGDNNELEMLIASLCDWDFNCCSDGEIDYRLGPFTQDSADCAERYVEQLYSNDDVAETQRGDLLFTLGFAVRLDRSTPNPDAATACRELMEDRACNEAANGGEVFCEPGGDAIDNPCSLRSLFTGIQGVGDPCSGALANLGFDIECEAGSSCEEVDGTFVCVDKGLTDEFCEADFTCDEGLFCDISTGRCAEKSNVGESCAFEDELEPTFGTETLPCKEHLTCDPQTNQCVAFCATGYDCSDDAQCVQGESCIPTDIGDSTFTYCQPRGNANGDRCDSDRDCGDALHCSGASCASDLAQNDPCAAANECEAGLFCSLGVTNSCEIVVNANQPCASDLECNPSTTLGCMTSGDGTLCRTAPLSNGDDCVPGQNAGGNWCASGVCEDITNDALPNPQCHLGATVGSACDSSPATFDVHVCADGLYCDEGTCALKLDAGGDCTDDAGLQCLNAACVPIWEGDYCTDAVPVGDLDDAATCDGA